MKKKQIAALFLTVVMLAGTAACGKKEEAPAEAPAPAQTEAEDEGGESEAPAETPAAASDLEIGVNIQEFSNAYLTLMRNGMQASADGLGIKLDIVDGQSDSTVISNNIDQFLTKGYPVLAVNMMNTTDAPGILEKTDAEGVPVVFFNVEPEADVLAGSATSYYVGAKAEASGVMQGEAIAEYWNNNPDADRNGDGTLQYVMIMGEPGHQDAIIRTESSVKAIEDAGIKVEELACETANWARAERQDVMASILTAHDDIEAIICNNDEMALGAIEALKAAGYLTDGGTFIPIVGVDATEEAQKAISEGTMYASVFNDAAGQADAVVKLCQLIAGGETPTSENLGYDLDGQYVWVPYIPVTADNLDTIQ